MVDKQYLKQLARKSLSGAEVMDAIDHKARLLTYPDLVKYSDIYEALGPHRCLILLMLSSHNYGHWVCIFELGNTLQYFNSYGKFDNLHFIDLDFRIQNNELIPHLSVLLLGYHGKVFCNHYKLQVDRKGVNTCGRHVICRILMRNLNDVQYGNWIRKNKLKLTPDLFVTYLTQNIK